MNQGNREREKVKEEQKMSERYRERTKEEERKERELKRVIYSRCSVCRTKPEEIGRDNRERSGEKTGILARFLLSNTRETRKALVGKKASM